MNVLVTGGAGFIGSHVAESLLRQGCNVEIFDNFDTFYPEAWKRRNLEEIGPSDSFKLFEDDICEESMVDHVFSSFAPNL